MIFGFKKDTMARAVTSAFSKETLLKRLVQSADPVNQQAVIGLQSATLLPSISQLSLTVNQGDWLILDGKDEFAKALFCDLCFQYIEPDSGLVKPRLNQSDVIFLGRLNTTYGKTLVDHLNYLVREQSKELLEYVMSHVLSERFKRLLSTKNPLEFSSPAPQLDERDLMEIAEANLLLQRKRAAVVDTTSDFYQIALEQGFRHSELFLKSGKVLFWIADNEKTVTDRLPFRDPAYSSIRKTLLNFPAESPTNYTN